MSADIPTTPPQQLRAGDTAQWRRSLADYPASAGWELKYTLVSTTAAYNFASTADGDDFDINVPASTTAAWVQGRYQLTEYVTNGTDRFTLATTTVRVLADLAGATTTGIDSRTHARKVLDAIEAWLELRAPVAGKFELNGRRIENYALADLLALRDRYKAEVAREEAGAGRASKLLVRL